MSGGTDGRRRWRSEAVPLRLLGSTGALVAVGLAGCAPETFHRNAYGSAAECAVDYAPTQCTPRRDAGQAAYQGPIYRKVGGLPKPCNANDHGSGRLGRQLLVEPVQRGGFGTTCRSSSSSRNRGRSWFGSGG